VLDALERLVDRSLAGGGSGGTQPRCRMLETLRLFAGEQLRESGENDIVAERHPLHGTDVFDHADVVWDTMPVRGLGHTLSP
jgi:predicted ATPase